MHHPAPPEGNSGNFILRATRASNAAILKFVMTIKLRSVGATLLGGFAGLSLTTNIIPQAMEYSGMMDSFSARWDLGGFAVYSMMAWATGGWAVQRVGEKKRGALILGFVGLITGLLFTGVGIGTQLSLLLTGGGAALLYGAIGGLIIGDALRNPPPDDGSAPSTHGHGSVGDLRLFKYFTK